MLTCILPSPALAPAAAVAWYLKNPLLLAAYPGRMAATAAAHAAGEYEGQALHKLAEDLSAERNRLRLNKAVEPDDQPAMRDLLGLLQSRHLTTGERKEINPRIYTARPSEYDWLRAPIEAAIQSRAEADMLKIARVARLTNTPIVPASQLAA